MIYSNNYRQQPSFQLQQPLQPHYPNNFVDQTSVPNYSRARPSALVHQAHQSLIRRPFKIMAQMTPAEMEEFQNLSDKYQAELAGPLIGEKLPMNALVTEYAQADSTYVVKTTGLAATHGAYRAVKGDGQCGWRATVFSYFELLLHSGDPGLVQLEKIRFETFADMMTQIGMDYSLLADMFDYTWQLFDKVIEAVQNNVPDDNIILNILNDENPSNSVVYHFKMVTSAYMQLHPDDYEPFLEMPVDQYRVARIDPANQEIDQIGLQALTHAVIGAAGFGLEVLYLDRSVGDEVNAHQFSQSQQGNQTIRLLYRPGHYDIIYKDTQPMQVYLQPQHTTMTRMEEPQEFGSAHDFLFSPATMSTPQAPASYDAMFQPSGTYMQHVPYNNYYQPQHQPQMYTDMSWSAPPASQHIPPPMPMPSEPQPQHQSQTSTTRAHSSRSVTMSPSPPSAVPTASEPQIRMSSMMYNMGRHQAAPPGACTGSSANSPAYYDQHVDKFQPQMYNPSRDYDG